MYTLLVILLAEDIDIRRPKSEGRDPNVGHNAPAKITSVSHARFALAAQWEGGEGAAATHASVPTAVPMSRKSVRLKEADVVIPAGNEVGHFLVPSAARAQQLPPACCSFGRNFW